MASMQNAATYEVTMDLRNAGHIAGRIIPAFTAHEAIATCYALGSVV
jgi:hypothetical protein